jgi:uncharacterized Rmd1/YagE family protein
VCVCVCVCAGSVFVSELARGMCEKNECNEYGCRLPFVAHFSPGVAGNEEKPKKSMRLRDAQAANQRKKKRTTWAAHCTPRTNNPSPLMAPPRQPPAPGYVPLNGGGDVSSSYPPPGRLLDPSIPLSSAGAGPSGRATAAMPIRGPGARRPPAAGGVRPDTRRALAPGQVRVLGCFVVCGCCELGSGGKARLFFARPGRRRRPCFYAPTPAHGDGRAHALFSLCVCERATGVPDAPCATRPVDGAPVFFAPTTHSPAHPPSSPFFSAKHSQPGVLQRKEGRFVSLPENLDLEGLEEAASLTDGELDGAAAGLLAHGAGVAGPLPEARGRITIYCLAEALDTAVLAARLEARGPACLGRRYPEVYAGHYVDPATNTRIGELHAFDYGVIVLWSLTKHQEADVLANLVGPALEDALPPGEVEVDEFAYVYGPGKPSIADDTISLPARAVADATTKLAISHALAQSTKLCLYEERVLEVVEATRDLPEAMAATGRVPLSRTAVARLIGRVFLLKSAVNLLGSVLDVPDFFWDRPDSLQALYTRVCAYVELPGRVEVLNARFDVLNQMLDLARAYQASCWVFVFLFFLFGGDGVRQRLLRLAVRGCRCARKTPGCWPPRVALASCGWMGAWNGARPLFLSISHASLHPPSAFPTQHRTTGTRPAWSGRSSCSSSSKSSWASRPSSSAGRTRPERERERQHLTV